MMAAILIGSMIFLVLLGMPVAIAIGISAVLVMLLSGLPLSTMVQTGIDAANAFSLLAIPFFLLAGQIMERGGISRRIVDFAYGLVGSFRGGLAYVGVVASMFFGGISGSATADTAAIGSAVLPAMRQKRFNMPFSAALVAASGTLGIIIPPSIVMVILGVTANISIAEMFIGGIVPGILMGLAYMGVAYFHARKHDYPREPRPPLRKVAASFVPTILPLFTVVIVVVGLVFGVFTATEAGVAASAYALVLALALREFKLRDLGSVLVTTSSTTGMVMLLIVTSSIFGAVMTLLRIPEAMASFFLSFSSSPLHVFLAINVLLLLVGTFLDPTPIIIILAPLLLPVATQMGIDPVHFGVVFSVNMLVAQLSPPAGVPLFVSSGIARVPLGQVFLPIVPFLAVSIAVLLLITYVPALVLYLPSVLVR
jgi:C4-dicarboxylate transporter DctM subunit